MTRILTRAAALLMALTGPLMAQDMDHSHYANIVSGGAIWSLRVNDMHIRENINFGHGDSGGSISCDVLPLESAYFS